MIYGPQPLTEDDMKRWEAIQRAALELSESESVDGRRKAEDGRLRAEGGAGAGLSGKMPLPHGRKPKDYWWNN